MVIQVPMDAVQGYDGDQTALVIPDLSDCSMSSCYFRDSDDQPGPVSAKGLAGRWPNCWGFKLDYDKIVLTNNNETTDAFSSWVLIAKAGTPHASERIDVMTQALHINDGSLPQVLTVKNAYTELRKGSKNDIVVMRKSTAYPRPSERRHQ